MDSIDLTTNAGWISANALSAAFDGTADSITGAGYTLTDIAGEQFTAGGGLISLTDLDLGLYYVVETAPLPGSTAVKPFPVTVPTTDPENQNTWLYDVNVFPKNALTTATKTVEDSEQVKLGDPVVWTITGDIPDMADIDGYGVIDPLDTKLTYESTVVTLVDASGTELMTFAEGIDYTLEVGAATQSTVTVKFTEAGLITLENNLLARVQVTINTTVNAVGEIANTASVYTNEAAFNIEPGQPGGPVQTPVVETKWGNATLHKENKAGDSLVGASFSVYRTEADALTNTNPISLSGESVFTSDATGLVTFNGLRYSDFADGVAAPEGDANYQSYWLAEIQAPSGYELLAHLGAVDAMKTFTEPLASAVSISADQELVERVVADVEGYPYFIQLWGAELWDAANAADAAVITTAILEAIEDRIHERLDLDFYEPRVESLTPAEQDLLTASAQCAYPPLAVSELNEASSKSNDNVNVLLGRLVKANVLYRPRKGQYLYTAPKFREFLQRRVESA